MKIRTVSWVEYHVLTVLHNGDADENLGSFGLRVEADEWFQICMMRNYVNLDTHKLVLERRKHFNDGRPTVYSEKRVYATFGL